MCPTSCTVFRNYVDVIITTGGRCAHRLNANSTGWHPDRTCERTATNVVSRGFTGDERSESPAEVFPTSFCDRAGCGPPTRDRMPWRLRRHAVPAASEASEDTRGGSREREALSRHTEGTEFPRNSWDRRSRSLTKGGAARRLSNESKKWG